LELFEWFTRGSEHGRSRIVHYSYAM